VKKRRAPLIVLFDILFVYLFSTILEPAPGLSIKIEGEHLVPNVGVLINKSDSLHFITFKGDSDKFIELQKLENIKEHKFWTAFPCLRNKICASIPNSKILLYGKLVEEVSIITLGICTQYPSKCNSLKFVIDKNGELNREETAKSSPIVLNIKGFLK